MAQIYNIKHPKCGAAWQDICEIFPKQVKCKKCGEWLPAIYVPLIPTITATKGRQ